MYQREVLQQWEASGLYIARFYKSPWLNLIQIYSCEIKLNSEFLQIFFIIRFGDQILTLNQTSLAGWTDDQVTMPGRMDR